MAMPPPCRLLRASSFAAVCVSLTVAGHVGASQEAVPWAAAGIGGLGVLGVAWLLAGHERSAVTILAGLLGGQFGLHVLFAAVQCGGAAGHAGHGSGVPETVSGGAGMTLAHLVAAAVSAWWLWRGERLAWALARRVAAFSLRAVLALLEAAPLPRRPVVGGWRAPCVRVRAALLRHSVGLRSPPRSVFALL
ncbi:MFS transporter [Thermomonospora sp. CIF 1]|uniref:MFS transporter n=1 Tax=Thermomonospora sp. CIF 1 TaxID=1916083 RepID=UPI002580A6B4|nr:MFS transporter [Thermomonospora sp. CIF 1]